MFQNLLSKTKIFLPEQAKNFRRVAVQKCGLALNVDAWLVKISGQTRDPEADNYPVAKNYDAHYY